MEFRASVRSICVRELKDMKKRKKNASSSPITDTTAATTDSVVLLNVLNETLSCCDVVRSNLLTDAGVAISDAAIKSPSTQHGSSRSSSTSNISAGDGTVEDEKFPSSNLWYLTDLSNSSGEVK